MDVSTIVHNAFMRGLVIPAFNVPFPPMVKPIVEAVRDENSVAMIQVARVEWERFEAVSPEYIAEEYWKHAAPGHTLLHLDHVPALSLDQLEKDCLPIFRRAIAVGFQSVMIDGSALSFQDNVRVSRAAVELAHAAGATVEAELGAIMSTGQERKALTYDEIFSRRIGFTEPEDARRFANESGCDWLSVAVGSIHGTIATGLRDRRKPEARLDIDRIEAIRGAAGVPLVLHGGSGVRKADFLLGVRAGIAKVNIGTELRQSYEQALRERNDICHAREQVYLRCRALIRSFLHTTDDAPLLNG